MKKGAAAEVTAHSASWQFDGTYRADPPEASIPVSVPYALIGGEADRLLLTGLGEKDVVGIAGRLAEHGITGLAVASLTYPEGIKLDTPAVEQSIVDGTAALVHDIAGDDGRLRHGIGNSAGGGQLILAANVQPELFEQVTAVAPGPLNVEALGENFKQQARELLARFEAEGLKDILAADGSAGLMETMREVKAGLTYAGAVDNSVILAAMRGRLQIYVGERDQVAPALEYAPLAEGMITLVPGMGHSTLVNDAGCERMAGIIGMAERAAEPEATAAAGTATKAAAIKAAGPVAPGTVAPQPAV